MYRTVWLTLFIVTFDGAKSQFGIQTDIFKHNNNLSPQYNYFGGNALFEQIKAQQQQQQEQQQVFGNILNGSFAHLNNAQDGKPTTNKPGFNFFLNLGSVPNLNQKTNQPKLDQRLSQGQEQNQAQQPQQCKKSQSTVNGEQWCEKTAILKEEFETIDQNHWMVEQYIPTYSPQGQNFEFVSYRNSPSNVYASNNALFLKPLPFKLLDELRGRLDLAIGCTSKLLEECTFTQVAARILPPVASGKVRSRATFKYGQVDIKARLPRGDWIYPIINLVSVSNPNASIVLAYARGNDILTTEDGAEIGGRVLYGGALTDSSPEGRKAELKSYKAQMPFTLDTHTYSCTWTPDKIVQYVDSVEYATTYTNQLPQFKDSEFYLTLGVGVGGINDFPDNSFSGTYKKPWSNRGAKLLKQFFEAKRSWESSWTGDQCALRVDSVEITAL